ncbi:DUF7520 family protein [Halobellus sp. GM3]|uniref:DUF7520 family protein n=1 Tax=Halobellus sp. GM3 TaxID=3458410 RepID=UPI00403D97E7
MHSETPAGEPEDEANADDIDADPIADADDIDAHPKADADADPETPPTGRPGLGRKILLSVGASVVAISGIVGWIVGSNGAEAVPESTLFGTGLSIPTTPTTFALYGVVVSALILGVLFGLVELASRLEDGP